MNINDIADEVEEWTVPCRDCGAEVGWDCNHPFWSDDDGPHRSRTIDATIKIIKS